MDQHEVKLLLDQTCNSFLLRSFYNQLPFELQNEKYTKILAYYHTRKIGYCYYKTLSEELKNNRKFILECLRQNPFGILEMPNELKADFEFGLIVVQRKGDLYKFLSSDLKKNRIIALKAIKTCGSGVAKKILEEFSSDEEMALEAIKLDGMNFCLVHSDLRRNFDFVMKCVNLNPKTFMYVDESLRSNEELASLAVIQDSLNISYTSLNDNAEFVLECSRKSAYPKLLKYMQVYNNDEMIVSEIVKKNGLELEFAHDDIKSFNGDIVMLALNQDGRALQFVKSPLLDNEQINLTAIRNNPLALEFATERFKSNLEIVKSAVEQNPEALRFASAQIQDQLSHQRIETTLQVSNDSTALTRDEVFEKIRNKTKFHSLQFEEIQLVRRDEEVLMAAIKNDDDAALPYIKILGKEFIRKAIVANKKCLLYAYQYILDKDFILEACSHYSVDDF